MVTAGVKVNMTPSHPGDFIRTEIVEELGLDLAEAAAILGVRRTTLAELLKGEAALSPEIALRIEKAFDINMEVLLRMQAWYDTARNPGRGTRSRGRSLATACRPAASYLSES